MNKADLYCEVSDNVYNRMAGVLNELLKDAPGPLNNLFSFTVELPAAAKEYIVHGDEGKLSVLGLLNSLLLSKKWRIAAKISGDDPNKITGFTVIDVTPPPAPEPKPETPAEPTPPAL